MDQIRLKDVRAWVKPSGQHARLAIRAHDLLASEAKSNLQSRFRLPKELSGQVGCKNASGWV